MTPLKTSIFSQIRKDYKEYELLDDSQMNVLIFHLPNSSRLSFTGFRIIKNIFTAYSFQLPGDIKSKHQKSLSKLEYPYFLTQKRLVLFSEMDASVIKLSGGVKEFLEIYLD